MSCLPTLESVFHNIHINLDFIYLLDDTPLLQFSACSHVESAHDMQCDTVEDETVAGSCIENIQHYSQSKADPQVGGLVPCQYHHKVYYS